MRVREGERESLMGGLWKDFNGVEGTNLSAWCVWHEMFHNFHFIGLEMLC